MRLLVLVALAVPAAALSQGAPAARLPSPDVGALLASVDEQWRSRDAPGALDGVRKRLAEAEKLAPNEYEVLWRQARLYFWLSDDPSLARAEKSRLGKRAWEYGDRATAANPNRVEGWNYAAAGMGNYALGIGIFTALRQGIEGKFRERLARATRIDAKFEHGAIQTAWGKFWYELPWPKYDAKKSRHALEDALKLNPDNVRAYVYLADLLEKEDRPAEARAQLKKALSGPPGRYDAPEERRWQAVARGKLGSR